MSTPVRSAPTPVRSANPLVFSALRSPGSKHKALGKIEREVLGKKDVNCEQPAARAMPPPAPRTATKKAATLPPQTPLASKSPLSSARRTGTPAAGHGPYSSARRTGTPFAKAATAAAAAPQSANPSLQAAIAAREAWLAKTKQQVASSVRARKQELFEDKLRVETAAAEERSAREERQKREKELLRQRVELEAARKRAAADELQAEILRKSKELREGQERVEAEEKARRRHSIMHRTAAQHRSLEVDLQNQLKRQEAVADDLSEAKLTSEHAAAVRAQEQADRRKSLACRRSKLRNEIQLKREEQCAAQRSLVQEVQSRYETQQDIAAYNEAEQLKRRQSLAGRRVIARNNVLARRAAAASSVAATVQEVQARQETRQDFAAYAQQENESERNRLSARRLSHVRHLGKCIHYFYC
jgi:hypothetical protein